MRVLVACEFSGVVRDAFVRAGHDAMSCDLLPSETERPDGWDGHYRGNIFEILGDKSYHFDMMIAFPPCTYLCSSGLHWNARRPERRKLTNEALDFVLRLSVANIDRITIENPIGCLSTRWRKPDQIIQPWQFGEDAAKATCLWLKNLPLLVPTNILPGGRTARRSNQTASGQNKLPPSPTRAMDRSRTYQGIADAMAAQWGKL